jgi:NSS family neurotransmitter:Na+ symporter
MERWSSNTGFLLAAIGSAVGIGNIWRFSSVLGQNGGGAYLIPYLIAVFLFALPLMVLELMIGRKFRGTLVSAFRSVRPRFHILGWFLCGIVLLVLSYYLVITGWTIGYAVYALGGSAVSFEQFTGSYLPIRFFFMATLITGYIVSRGIREGIEKISTLLIPLCIGILVVMVIHGAFLPGFSEGVAYLFTPDFSVLSNPIIWSAAFGQAFFSLSAGQGILLTYGTYMEKHQNIPRLSFSITIVDLFVSLLAGLVIFPIVFTYGLAPAIGAELAFTSLPLAFTRMPGGQIFAIAFFIVLFFAALTSAISMLEVSVAAVRESAGWSRKKAALVMTGVLLLLGLPSALSYSPARLAFDGVLILDFMDETIGTLGLPLAAVIMSVVFSGIMSHRDLPAELLESRGIVQLVIPLCRYVIPLVLIITTALRLASGRDFPGTRFLPGAEFIGSVLQLEGMAVIVLLLVTIILLLCHFRSCGITEWIRKRKK